MKNIINGTVLTKRDGSFKAYQYKRDGVVIRTGRKLYSTAFLYGVGQDELAEKRKAAGCFYHGRGEFTFGKSPCSSRSKYWNHEIFTVVWDEVSRAELAEIEYAAIDAAESRAELAECARQGVPINENGTPFSF